MTKSNVSMGTSPWVGVMWCALGLLSFLIGNVWVLMAARHFNLWLYAQRYVPAELEVTRFVPQPGARGQGRTIEGVIHPGGESVRTSDRDIGVRQFVGPSDAMGRRVPLPGEIEGKRLAVCYWRELVGVKRWWHPPTIVMPGATERGGAAVRDTLLGGGFIGVGLVCFRRGVRYLKSAVPRATR
jgi:hypothetical protein